MHFIHTLISVCTFLGLIAATPVAFPATSLEERYDPAHDDYITCGKGALKAGNNRQAKSWITVQNMKWLDDRQYRIIEARQTQRVACQWNSAIYVTNRMDWRIKILAYDITADAHSILTKCCGPSRGLADDCHEEGRGRMFGPGSRIGAPDRDFDITIAGDKCESLASKAA